MAGMSEKHRNLLKNYRVALVKDLEPMKLLVGLSEVLDEEDVEVVKSENLRSRQAGTLLDILCRRGPRAFDVFVSALENKQPHLAKMLLKDSGVIVEPSVEGDYQMSKSHRQILRSNAGKLLEMELDRILPLMSVLLDQDDKSQILSRGTSTEKVEKFLLDILPRKGPRAFEHFVRVLEQVHPSMAQALLNDAGMERKTEDQELSNNKKSQETNSVQEVGSYTLDSSIQDVLEVSPELLTKFCESMDEEDDFGNGWKRLYEELGLPAGKEKNFVNKVGGPTFSIVKAWCNKSGRLAKVQLLMEAVYRSERGNSLYILEKSLGCRLDVVDSEIDGVTSRLGSLRAGEEKKIKFLGDLNQRQASAIARKLDETSDGQFRNCLEKELSLIDSEESSVKLLIRSKTYPIRRFTEFLRNKERIDVIQTMKSSLPKGVTGPLLFPDGNVRDMTYSLRAKLTRYLSGDAECWKLLAHAVGMDNSHVSYLDEREKNPGDHVLRFWEVKQNSTVGRLYDILVELGYPLYADIL